jgi:hypothetical protein
MKTTLQDAAVATDAVRSGQVDAEQGAAEYERRVRREMNQQFIRLKDEARALYGMVDGRPGVRSPKEWEELLERAGDEIGNGRFIVGCLGAERYLDALTVAVLITFRQGLIADKKELKTADIMMIDAAVVAYYNMLRVQGWMGNLALVVERQLFGQDPLNSLDGGWPEDRVEARFQRLSEVMLPLLDRCQRMMGRSLAAVGR